MEPGLNMLSKAMTLKLHETDVIANNIANSNTTGFKQQGVSTQTTFSDEIAKNIESMTARKETALNSTIPKLSSSHIDNTPGAMKLTNNPYDFALKDKDTMFMVQLENGQIGYTRDGSFKSSNGMLTTGDGKLVLGNGGGVIELAEGEEIVPSVAMVDYANIKPTGNNIYITKNNEALPIIENSDEYVLKGTLETSNVNIVQSMTNLITAHRGYEQMSKLMKGIDEINSKAANDVGNVKG